MAITRQDIIDAYNSIYSSINGGDRTYISLTEAEKFESLLVLLNNNSGGSSGGGGTGDASAAKQDEQTALLTTINQSTTTYLPTIDSTLSDINLNTANTVSALSDVATATNQSTQTTALNSIDSKIIDYSTVLADIESNTFSTSGTVLTLSDIALDTGEIKNQSIFIEAHTSNTASQAGVISGKLDDIITELQSISSVGGGTTSEVTITDGVDDLLVNTDGSINVLLNAGTNNIGDVDVLSLPSIPAGTNNIGDVDVLTLPVSYNSGATDATTQRTITATNSPEVAALGTTADTSATTDTGTFSIISFIKRLLSVKLPSTLGTKTAANSFAVIPASDYVAQAGGNVAAAATDSGNPVKIGGVYNTTRPTYTNGQRGNVELSVRGGILADFEDYVSNPNNINTVDVASSTVAGANNQNIITGNPTNNSFASVLFSGNSSFAVLISGTWVGTLQFERTLDSGTTWTSVGAFSAGTNFITQTTTQNGAFHGNASSSNGIRVRATSWTSGVANVRILLGNGTGTITIGNPIRLFDQVNNVQANIKPASTAALGTDTALVVATRFNQFAAETQLTAPGTTTSLDVTPYQNITCQYVVASINTSINVRVEGSNDGTNWFNLSATNTDTTITANGVYAASIANIALYRVRFNFVSETGGTAATVDVRFTAN